MEAGDGWPVDHLGEIVGHADRALMKMHLAVRPAWECMACGDPWPCLIARVTLTDELGEHLRDAMSTYAAEARRDLEPRGVGAAEMFERFLRWINAPGGKFSGSAPVPNPE